MSGTVRGDPERLEAYTEATEPAIDRAIAAVEEYSRAIAAFNAARPNDLGTSLSDLGPELLAKLEALRRFARLPAAFAFALRNIDRVSSPGSIWVRLDHTRQNRFDALAIAWTRDPQRPDHEIVIEAGNLLDHQVELPWEGHSGPSAWTLSRLRDPVLWTSAVAGGAPETVVRVNRSLVVPVGAYTRANGTQVAAHWRWRPHFAQRLNPITQARTIGRLAPAARAAGPAVSVVFAGAGQIAEDWGDESLTTGDRVARTATTTLTEGGGAWAGAWAGAQAGAWLGGLVGGPIGAVVGGVVGGVIGGTVGGELGSAVNDNISGAVESFGDKADAAIELGGDILDDLGDPL